MHISVKDTVWYVRAERKTDMLSHENGTTSRVSFIHIFFSGGHVEVNNALGCLMCKKEKWRESGGGFMRPTADIRLFLLDLIGASDRDSELHP